MTDAQIARLFTEEQRLERALFAVRGRIAAARGPYAERNHLLMYPSVETMRKAITSSKLSGELAGRGGLG